MLVCSRRTQSVTTACERCRVCGARVAAPVCSGDLSGLLALSRLLLRRAILRDDRAYVCVTLTLWQLAWVVVTSAESFPKALQTSDWREVDRNGKERVVRIHKNSVSNPHMFMLSVLAACYLGKVDPSSDEASRSIAEQMRVQMDQAVMLAFGMLCHIGLHVPADEIVRALIDDNPWVKMSALEGFSRFLHTANGSRHRAWQAARYLMLPSPQPR
jgi:hypothetical protein